VITVHGFNSPRDAVLKTYAQSFQSVNGDKALHDRGVICVGYRWPRNEWERPGAAAHRFAHFFARNSLHRLAAVYS